MGEEGGEIPGQEKTGLLARGGVEGGGTTAALSIHSGSSGTVQTGANGAHRHLHVCTSGRTRRGSMESNYEEASTKAMAGSAYCADDKSVHTMGGLSFGMGEGAEDEASTRYDSVPYRNVVSPVTKKELSIWPGVEDIEGRPSHASAMCRAETPSCSVAKGVEPATLHNTFVGK